MSPSIKGQKSSADREEERLFHRYIELLANERSFDGLFCETVELGRATLLYNSNFLGDPVFNHVKLSEDLMSDGEVRIEEFEEVLQEIDEVSRRLSLKSITLFLEDFWANSSRFQTAAVETGYRIVEQMKILSMQVGRTVSSGEETTPNSRSSSKNQVSVFETDNVEAWNKVFMRSYQIPEEWKIELLRREKGFLKENGKSTMLLLALEGNEKEISRASGCLLLHEFPAHLMGVYCVGTIPEKRGRGIARKMLEESDLVARRRDCDFLTLQTVASDNVTPMYLKLGYNLDFERSVLHRV